MRNVLPVIAGVCLLATPALAQLSNLACNPTCHEVTGPTNPTQSSRSTSTSSSNARATSSSRSQATGSIAGTQVNAPITSRSQGGSASVTVINQASSGSRSGGHYGGSAGAGSSGGGGSNGWHSRAATQAAATVADPPASDPGPTLGSAQNPLTQNTNVSGTQTLRDVPEIVAPNISGGNPCLVGISGGGAGPGIGITLGIGYSDKGCERRNDAAVLSNIGEKAAAIEVLCEDDNIRAALARAGRPCEQDRPRPVATAPAAQANGIDPAVIRRQQQIPMQEVAITPAPKPRTYPDWCYTASAAELARHPECSPH